MNDTRIPQLVDHLFRHESGKMKAALTRILGVNNLAIAEEIVQETLLKALQTWPYHQIPDNPGAWLMQAAKNKAIDLIRKERHRQSFARDYEALLQSEWTLVPTVDAAFAGQEIEDVQLRMMFVCCHPSLADDVKIALTLHLLGGLTAREIGAAFLTSEAAMKKRLFRAKRKLQQGEIPFEIPRGKQLLSRLDSVLHVLYLMFNEGYHSSHSPAIVRGDLCGEALRLTRMVADHPGLGLPQVNALSALFCFHGARLPARINPDGSVNLLKDQDRSLWNRSLLQLGTVHLAKASSGDRVTRYHLEAGIAAQHSLAERFEDTDFPAILNLYDRLLELGPNPVIRMNRAVTLGYAESSQAAITALAELEKEPSLSGYHLLPAMLGEFHLQEGRCAEAARYFAKAIGLTSVPAEKRLLEEKLSACG